MNKYTLSFFDKVLEREYEMQKTQKLLQPVYMVTTFACIVYLLSKSVQEAILHVYGSIVIKLVISAIGLLIYCFTRRKPQLLVFGASYVNIMLILFQGTMNLSIPAALAYCFGGNMMLLQCILMISYKFQYGLVHNCLLLLGRTIITYFQAKNSDFEVYIVNFCIFIFLSLIIYQLDKSLREIYQLTLKDDSYDSIVPLIVDKPFAVFQYNSQTLQYQIVHGNMTQRELIQLLREYNYNYNTFEQFILQQYQDSQSFKTIQSNKSLTQMELSQKFKKIPVKFAQFYVPNLQFLIIMGGKEDLMIQKEKYCDQLIQRFHIYQRQIIQQLKCALKVASFKKVSQTLMIIQETYFHQYLYLDHQEIAQVDLKQIILFYYRSNRLKNKIEFTSQENQFNISTNRPLLNLLIIQIMRLLSDISQLKVVNKEESYIIFILNQKEPILISAKLLRLLSITSLRYTDNYHEYGVEQFTIQKQLNASFLD